MLTLLHHALPGTEEPAGWEQPGRGEGTGRDRTQGWGGPGDHHSAEAVRGKCQESHEQNKQKKPKLKNNLSPGIVLSPGTRKHQLIQEE